MGLQADFTRLPEVFLMMYREPLLRWASNLEEQGPLLKIDLMKPAGQSVLHVDGVEPSVTLECRLWKRGVDTVMEVRPASEFDAELVIRHCEELPRLQVAANENLARPKARKHVDAVFQGMPEDFVHLYANELRSWGGDFGRRGPNATIVLRDIPAMPVALDEHGQRPMVGVHLTAKVDRARRGDDVVRLVVSPETEDDRRKIAKHMADVAKWGQPVAPVGRPKSRATVEVPGVH